MLAGTVLDYLHHQSIADAGEKSHGGQLDLNVHLACINRAIAWCFALNKVNYTRYPQYTTHMTQLEKVYAVMYQRFQRSEVSFLNSSYKTIISRSMKLQKTQTTRTLKLQLQGYMQPPANGIIAVLSQGRTLCCCHEATTLENPCSGPTQPF